MSDAWFWCPCSVYVGLVLLLAIVLMPISGVLLESSKLCSCQVGSEDCESLPEGFSGAIAPLVFHACGGL